MYVCFVIRLVVFVMFFCKFLTPSEFRTAFRNRLLIPHPQLLAHTTCACGQDVDVLGVHTQKC